MQQGPRVIHFTTKVFSVPFGTYQEILTTDFSDSTCVMCAKHVISPISPENQFGDPKRLKCMSDGFPLDTQQTALEVVPDSQASFSFSLPSSSSASFSSSSSSSSSSSPSSSTLSNLETLPSELLQEIAWIAHNPLLYLVSKTITSKLFALKDYEYDLGLLLWCDRSHVDLEAHQNQSDDQNTEKEATHDAILRSNSEVLAWNLVPDRDFPWKTPVAKQDNLKLDFQQRLQCQREVFDLVWLTEEKFHRMGDSLMNFWLDYRWQEEDFDPKSYQTLQDERQDLHPLELDIPARAWADFSASYTHRTTMAGMQIIRGCKVRIAHGRRNQGMYSRLTPHQIVTHSLMDNLYIPSYVFDVPQCSTDNLLPMMRHCRTWDQNQCMSTAKAVISKMDATLALRKSIKDSDQVAFVRLFCLLLSQKSCDDISRLDPVIRELVKRCNSDPTRVLSRYLDSWAMDGFTLWQLRPDGLARQYEGWSILNELFDIVARYDDEGKSIGLL